MSALPVRLLGSLDGLPLYRSSIPGDADDNKATAQTIRKMCEHVRECLNDPVVKSAAETALGRYGRVALPNLRRRAWGVWWYAKHLIKFVQDETLLASMLNEHGQRELLNPPPVMLRMKQPQGDCDDYTMLVCALLKCLGVPFEVVTVAADPTEPDRWSHVYAVALVEDGARFPMDTSHGKFPGWEVPREHIIRYQAWNESGEPVAGRGPSVRSRLNGYMPRGLGARRIVRRRRGLFGLGQDDSTGTTITDSSSLSDIWSSLANDNFGLPTSGLAVTDFTSTPASGSSASTTAAEFNLANTFAKIFGQSVSPQATVTGPGGLSVQGPASTIASIFGGSGSSSLTSSSLSSLLPLLLLAGGAILLISMMKK